MGSHSDQFKEMSKGFDLAQAIAAFAKTPRLPEMRYEIDDGRPGGYDWPAQREAALQAKRGVEQRDPAHQPADQQGL